MDVKTDFRGFDIIESRLKRIMPLAVKRATEDLKAAPGRRTGALRRSIKGKVISPTHGIITARFYVFPHLVQKLKRKNATAKIVFEGASRGAAEAMR